MQSTERLRPITWLDAGPSGRSPWYVLLTLTLAACVAFDLALVLLPDFSRMVIAAFRDLEVRGPGGAWVTLALRSGVAMGGGALGLAALVAFARGVMRAPFEWLTPVLVSFCTILVACMQVTLPLPISLQAYALASAFLFLGGGALLQVGRGLHVFVGTLIVALPVALLATSYITPSAPALVTSVKMVFFVLTACSVGVVLVAMLAPTPGELFDRRKLQRDHEIELARALQHVRQSEERVSIAEAQIEAAHHSLRVQGAELEAALSVQDEAAVLTGQRNRTIRSWLLAITVVGSLGSMVAAYFTLYAPLQKRVHAGAAAIAKLHDTHARELTQQRTLASSEHTALRTKLDAAQLALNEATAALTLARAETATLRAELETATSAASAPKAASKPKVGAARKPARPKPHGRVKPQPTAATRSEPARASSTSRASAADDSNDPIGGLDL